MITGRRECLGRVATVTGTKETFESICFNFLSFFCELVFERFKSGMTLKVRN
jgi:hypothetical protein